MILHTYVKMYCNTKQSSSLPFCVPNSKPHGARDLNKYYHLRFDIKLVNYVCAIFHIPCTYVACTSIIDKPWISHIPLKNKNTINLSSIAPIGQFLGCSIIGTSSSCHINQPLMAYLIKYTRLFLVKLVII